jgi:hypothetical protein
VVGSVTGVAVDERVGDGRVPVGGSITTPATLDLGAAAPLSAQPAINAHTTASTPAKTGRAMRVVCLSHPVGRIATSLTVRG